MSISASDYCNLNEIISRIRLEFLKSIKEQSLKSFTKLRESKSEKSNQNKCFIGDNYSVKNITLDFMCCLLSFLLFIATIKFVQVQSFGY